MRREARERKTSTQVAPQPDRIYGEEVGRQDAFRLSSEEGTPVRLTATRRRWQAALLLLVGLALLVGGIMVDVRIGDFPIVSLVGFFVMFGGGLLLIFAPRGGSSPSAKKLGAEGKKVPEKGSFSSRMEDRFNKRFDQDGR